MLVKASYDDTISRVQTLSGIHVSSHQTLAGSFECSGPPSRSQVGENMENLLPVRYEVCMCFMLFATV